MTCKGVLGSLSDYIEGEAGKKVCVEIEEHLDGCEKCRMHVDTMRMVVTLYKGWRADPIPEDVSKRLRKTFADTVRSLSDARRARKGARAVCSAKTPSSGKRKSIKVAKRATSGPAGRSGRTAKAKRAGRTKATRRSRSKSPTRK